MKTKLFFVAAALCFSFSLISCGNKTSKTSDEPVVEEIAVVEEHVCCKENPNDTTIVCCGDSTACASQTKAEVKEEAKACSGQKNCSAH